jgi:hypothetical protein
MEAKETPTLGPPTGGTREPVPAWFSRPLGRTGRAW